MPLLFATALQKFESWLRVEKNLSPRTRTAYLYDLGRLREFLAGGDPAAQAMLRADQITPEQLKGWVLHLRENLGLKATTLSRALSSTRAFFDFCVAEMGLAESPALVLETPRLPPRLPVYLVDGELQKLLAAPDVSTPAGLRDRAILLLLSFCGLRLQEVVRLDVIDVSFEAAALKVFGKGSKERLLPMNQDVEAALRSWLMVREAVEGERAVFTNRFGRRLGGRMIEKLVDRYRLAAGLNRDDISPHKLRHTFATLLHSNDVELMEIQALLGHASITTTQIYTHTNIGRLTEAVERISDLGA